MKKQSQFLILILFSLFLLPLESRSQETEIFGWLRFDTRNQEHYGICKFTAENPGNISVLYPHDPEEVACAGAFANNRYYVYLYHPREDGSAAPLSFNYVDLSTGTFRQIADYKKMSSLYSDMTYDYSTRTMFALGKRNGLSTLLRVDLDTGESTPVGNMERLYITLACSYEGEMYAIDGEEGILWKIDKSDGTATEIGSTYEIPALYLQSMEFDHETNTLYWAANDTRDNGFLSKINLETGESTRIDVLGNDAQVVGLYIPFVKTDPDAPGAVSGVAVTAGAGGVLSAVLSWKNPSVTSSGGILRSLTGIRIYRNEEPVCELAAPAIGENATWTDTGMESGVSTYRIVAVNEKGESASVSASLFVGRDVPAAPRQPLLTIAGKSEARIAWEAPETGLNGGWFDRASLTYTITRLPDRVTVAESLTGTEFTDRSITSLNNYSYEIRSASRDGAGGQAVTGAALAGPSITVPYRCDFATEEMFALWNVIDANGDNYTWKRETTLNAAYYYYNEDGTTPSDDWLISSPIRLEKDKRYRLSMKVQSYDEEYPEKLGVYLGTGKSVAGQTTLLGEFVVAGSTFSQQKMLLPEELETGDYHLSFHCHSDPGMFILYLTDLFLEEVSEGSLSGVVTDGSGPVENATVSLVELGRETKTDANGQYRFEEVKTGTYTLHFSKLGYRSFETAGVEITFGEFTSADASLEALPVYSVGGKVLNMDRKPVGAAKIVLEGYNRYVAQTDANGSYLIPEVWQADGYRLIIERYGLRNDTLTLDVKDKNLTVREVILKDKPLPPYLPEAVADGGRVTVGWREPVDNRVFRHDNGTHAGRLGTTSSTVRSVYGSVFRTAARLTGMTWFTENYLTSHPTVNVFVFDLDVNGEPTSKLLYSESNVPNKDMEWTTFEFSSPVDAPNGYMLALSFEGHVGLGLDDGQGPEYPFTPHTNCYAEDYTTGKFTYTEEHDIRRSLMIRGIGILRGEDELPSMTTGKKYSVWRLTDDRKEKPEEWELLTPDAVSGLTYTDTKWENQKQGLYRYAVKTEYNNGKISSKGVYTRVLVKDMLTRITVKVNTNTPVNESKGAKVTITHSDNHPEHVYTGVVDGKGEVTLENVWKGVYTAKITHKGFEDLEAGRLDFTTEPAYLTPEMVLKEYVVDPFNLEVVKTGKEAERRFSWNVVDFIFDDFDSHADFEVNSPGTAGWSYLDEDGKKTYGMDGVKFPNSGQPMAFIIFNPEQTDPGLSKLDPHIRPHSGSKFLATFPANPGPNNDFIISPELSFTKDFTFKFYAKSYSDEYGFEQMNVGYSLKGKSPADFIWLNSDSPVDLPMGEWKEYSYKVPAAAKRVAINCVSDNVFIFMVDDVFIGTELPEGLELDRMKQDLSFEVYLDGKKLATTQSPGYLLNELPEGKHTAGVKAVFSSRTTAMAEMEFEVEEGSSIPANEYAEWSVSPNPASDVVHVTGEFDYLAIYDLSGTELARHAYGKPVSVNNLAKGVYLIKIVRKEQSRIFKLIVEPG